MLRKALSIIKGINKLWQNESADRTHVGDQKEKKMHRKTSSQFSQKCVPLQAKFGLS